MGHLTQGRGEALVGGRVRAALDLEETARRGKALGDGEGDGGRGEREGLDMFGS